MKSTTTTTAAALVLLWTTAPPPCVAFQTSPKSSLVRMHTPNLILRVSSSSPYPGVIAVQRRPSPARASSSSSLFLFRDLFNRMKGDRGGGGGVDGEEEEKEDDDDINVGEGGGIGKGKDSIVDDGTSLETITTTATSATITKVDGVDRKAEESAAVESLSSSSSSTTSSFASTSSSLSSSSSSSSSPDGVTTEVEKLRAQASRLRLEAERRRVELTLEKIARLTARLDVLNNRGSSISSGGDGGYVKNDDVGMGSMRNADADRDRKSLEEEIGRLTSQLAVPNDGTEGGKVEIASNFGPSSSPAIVTSITAANATTTTNKTPERRRRQPPSDEEIEERTRMYRNAPEFVRLLVARTVGFDVDGSGPGAVDRLDDVDVVRRTFDDGIDFDTDGVDAGTTAVAREAIERAYRRSSGDDNDDDDNENMPVFTKEQIMAKEKELEDIPKFLKNMVTNNMTELATSLLEDEWLDERKEMKQRRGGNGGGFFGLFGRGGNGDDVDDGESVDGGEIGGDGERMDLGGVRGTFGRLFADDSSTNGTSSSEGGMPKSEVDFMMNTLYPKSTRKEGETPDRKTVDAFLNDVVAPTKAFSPNTNPISVAGGWIIRGKNNCKSGDELIEKLDRRIGNDARLRQKISFFILKDPFPDPEEQMFDPLNWPHVLFVTGPKVARDSEVVLRTAISAFGIATAWYGSIYPFLANPKLLDRATEAMELADAGMQTDLSWLSEMSIPLFSSFMALQLVHEIAHQAVARSKNFEATIPTLVPSVLSGITNSITSLKSSPKNKQDLVEFALAGPLVGMLASILVLCYGLVLTATADVSTVQSFPGIPLAILRQSSLGGGLIDLFLGNGVLNVPASADAAQALASTLIALHPFAVSGFFSLIVNALALVPAGRTDGGRISMALFGRSGCQAVTFGSLATLFVLGISQSDLLLFYFAFIIFFQSELEIPMRNEVDDVDFSRVVLATFAGFLTLLSLIPM